MDLQLHGKKALIWGGSKGMGFACASALTQAGVDVTIAARTESTLRDACNRLKNLDGWASSDGTLSSAGNPSYAVADLRSVAGRAAALAVCPAPDILINNADGPKVTDVDALTRSDWEAAFDAMALGPIEMIKAVIDGMRTRQFGRIINITSRSVKTPQHELGLSNGARSVLTGFTAGLARAVARDGVTINNILPGIFETDAQKHHIEGLVTMTGQSFDEIKAERAKSNPAGRYGDPREIGALAAFLASPHAGFINAQNLLIDGGGYPGTF
jgi:3-oxoacyl-[acyl-carrier protein] reductase